MQVFKLGPSRLGSLFAVVEIALGMLFLIFTLLEVSESLVTL